MTITDWRRCGAPRLWFAMWGDAHGRGPRLENNWCQQATVHLAARKTLRRHLARGGSREAKKFSSGSTSAQTIEEQTITGLVRCGETDVVNQVGLRAPHPWQDVQTSREVHGHDLLRGCCDVENASGLWQQISSTERFLVQGRKLQNVRTTREHLQDLCWELKIGKTKAGSNPRTRKSTVSGKGKKGGQEQQ